MQEHGDPSQWSAIAFACNEMSWFEPAWLMFLLLSDIGSQASVLAVGVEFWLEWETCCQCQVRA